MPGRCILLLVAIPRPRLALLFQQARKLNLDALMVERFGLGQPSIDDHLRDQALDPNVVQWKPVDVDAVLSARAHPGLPAGGGTALTIWSFRNARRIEPRGDVLEPLPSAPRVDAGGGDAEASKGGVGEREHLTLR